MADSHVLRDAITYGYLPAGSTTKDLNPVRQKMLIDGRLHSYGPDGSRNTPMTFKIPYVE